MAGRRKLTDEQIAQIVPLYESGLLIREIAERFGVTPSAIQNRLSRSSVRREHSHKLTKEERGEIVRRYQAGENAPQLATEYGITIAGVCWHLKKHGIETRLGGKLDRATRDSVGAMYAAGESANQIARKLGVDQGAILGIMKRRGIQRRPKSSYRKHCFNERYFDAIDTEGKAYMLGFIYADGSHDENLHVLKLSVRDTDREILEHIRLELESSAPIRQSPSEKKSGMVTLLVASKHFSRRLVELGCMQSKTLKLKYPDFLPKALHRHFLRGYIDGDGCIIAGGAKRPHGHQINFVGTPDFCGEATRVIGEFTGARTSTRLFTRKNTVSLVYVGGGRQVEAVLRWLYTDASIYLSRKHAKYMQIIHQREHIDVSHVTQFNPNLAIGAPTPYVPPPCRICGVTDGERSAKDLCRKCYYETVEKPRRADPDRRDRRNARRRELRALKRQQCG